MLNSTALLAALVVTILGVLIFWSNPRRTLTRLLFSCSLHIACWLILIHLAVDAPKGEGLIWLKWACSVASITPFHFWLIKESIAADSRESRLVWRRQNWAWVIVSVVLVILPFTEFFVPSHSSATQRLRGWGFYGFFLGVLGLYVVLLRDTLKTIKKIAGGRRLELQVWLLGGCAAAAAILILWVLNERTHDPIYVRLQPLAVLVLYGSTALAITTYRIFDARQIMLVGVEKLILVGTVAALAYSVDWVLKHMLPEPFDFVVTTALALGFAALLNGWLDRFFSFYPQATVARQAAYTAARSEVRIQDLQKAFLSILKGWGQTEIALVLSSSKEGQIEDGSPQDAAVLNILKQLHWATPERLAREKITPERRELWDFLERNKLGAIVISEGPTLAMFVGVGIAASRRPFTYPQITQLMELSSIIESAFERAHFSTKAQHAEQLATVGLLGASLAHEIRNPLVSIKTFVQLLPTHHADPVFRENFFRLIGDEVSRIDRLTEQLLDLATPRRYSAETVHLHPVLRETIDLAAVKGAGRQIDFQTDFKAMPDLAFTDSSAAKQVVLNLCFNAIQAMEGSSGPQWIRISTRNNDQKIEMTVSDSGPGISAEMLPRMFQPFQSSKSTGFGLGLAICSDILTGLKATITVDPPSPGRGATFRINFPCPPLSS